MPNAASVLEIGRGALYAAQLSINTTGNNIANVNTPNYSRQRANLEEGVAFNGRPGQIGTGVVVTDVVRNFDEFVEALYNDKASQTERWDITNQRLQDVETMFNETDTPGISSNLAAFWHSWQDLSGDPSAIEYRSALVSNTQNLTKIVNQVSSDLENNQVLVDKYIQDDVKRINDLIWSITDLNNQIEVNDIPGQNNTNELYDKRTGLIRELGELIDIKVTDNGGGRLIIAAKCGVTLVSGVEPPELDKGFGLKFEAPRTIKALTKSSSFDGEIWFEGSSEHEYLVECVSGGSINSGSDAAMFRVSYDGGATWQTDENGNTKYYYARPQSGKVTIGDLNIWFGKSDNPGAAPSNPLSAGDKFEVVPKKGLYWYINTSSSVNVTPQEMSNGSDNPARVTGGSLAGYFNYRDGYLGRYKEKLNEFSRELTWNVNRLHSQGAGLEKLSLVSADYSVSSTNTALGSDSTGLVFGNKMTAGNVSMYIYDSTSGALVSNAAIDFRGVATGIRNFDPSVHTLQNLADAINNTFGGRINASISNNKLVLQAANGNNFVFGSDSSGLLAALGVNTYFQGNNASTFVMNEEVRTNLNFINAGHVNGAGEANSGDNKAALAIAMLQQTKITFKTSFEGTTNQTIDDYYNSLVTNVGADTAMAAFNFNYNDTLKKDLDARQQEVSGVNLDEEMTDLIKFQHAYTAAAKLISTADQMFSTLLTLKN